jgi:RNA polymerase sigma factor (sigma-70 family)
MSVDDLVSSYRSLARMIASEFTNIPGASLDEIASEAEVALLKAARSFDAEKGEFEPFAAVSIRNALRSFFVKQVRYCRINEIGAIQGASGEIVAADEAADVILNVRAIESRRALEEVLVGLPPRYRVVVDGIRAGRSYADIGTDLNVTKQAIHKVAAAAFASLREKLLQRGYGGIDSQGGLRSADHSVDPNPPAK